MNTQLVDVAIAILYLDNRFLMQLRDNIPNIIYPGQPCGGSGGARQAPAPGPAPGPGAPRICFVGFLVA